MKSAMSVTGDDYKKMRTLFSIYLILIFFAGCATTTRESDEVRSNAKSGAEETSSSRSNSSNLSNSVLITELTEPEFYPKPPQQPRLQFLTTINSEDELKSRDISLTTSTFLKIKRPYDMGSVNGRIYISDRKFLKVLVVDLNQRTLRSIAGPYEAAGIWVTDDDYKYIADFSNRQIIVFDDNNKIAGIYKNDELFDKPTDVAVFEDRIYVCDLNKHQIFVIDKDSGDIIHQIGGVGTEEGKFYKPTHVIVDREGNLYVNDFFNLRIQKLDPDGNHIRSFGQPGDTLGAFARPKGISIDREGHLYAVDAAFENVQIFDNETTDLLLFYGVFGLEPGNTYLPNAIFIDYHNVNYFKQYAHKDFDLQYLVYVGNTWGPVRLNVYGFGNWIGPAFEQAELGQEESNESKN